MNKFKTETFNLLTTFELVKKDAEIVYDDTITVAGYANYCGPDADGDTLVDLAGDVVVPEGMDITIWASNPIILLNHNREQVIGKGLKIEKRTDGIYIEASIHRDAMDDQDWYRFKSGLISRFSVGFRTIDGSYKEVDGDDVFFITKSLLLEISCVVLPANYMSSFSIIKSLTDGTFTSKNTEVVAEKEKHHNLTHEEDTLMNIKVKRADLLSAEDLEKFKELGGEPEAEVEVSLADFIKDTVAKEVAAVLAAKEVEAKAAAEEAAKLEVEAKAAAEESRIKAESEAKAAEEKAIEEEFSVIKTLVTDLKAAIEAGTK